MTDEQPSAPATADAVIEVRRRRRVSEVMAIGWRVFIDGLWAGEIPQGKSVRFAVAPGRHSLVIWSHRGAYCSDEVALDAAPGSVYTYECRSRQMPVGISRAHEQAEVVTSTMREGGVTKGAILLTEVPPAS